MYSVFVRQLADDCVVELRAICLMKVRKKVEGSVGYSICVYLRCFIGYLRCEVGVSRKEELLAVHVHRHVLVKNSAVTLVGRLLVKVRCVYYI